MPDVILSNDDITVLGPPETVELLVDIGPTGERGSKFFVGTGEPNSLTSSQTIFSEDIYLYDMYINAAPGTNYGYMYQYISEPGGNTWSQVLKISPTLYSKNHTTTFTSGEASITVPIANIVTVSGTPLTASNFNIQYFQYNTINYGINIALSRLIHLLLLLKSPLWLVLEQTL